MCKPYPGPRCSNHALARKNKLWGALRTAREQHEKSSLQVEQAEAAYQQALEEYLATPAGLTELAANPSVQAKYRRKREYQLEALQETQNQRTKHISQLASGTQTFFTAPEIETILNASRVREENQNPLLEPGSDEGRENQYQKFLGQYEKQLKNAGLFTPEMQATLMELRSMPAPAEQVSLNVYRNLSDVLKESQTQLKQELHRVGLLQDTSTTTAAVYFEAYRDEYNNLYSKLPKKQQPTAPAEWVEGLYPHTGYRGDVSTSLIPTDPATMYALHRLRSDPKAIPDYRKQARVLAAVMKTSDTVNVTSYNTKGNLVDSYQTTPDNMFEVAGKLEGKILVTVPDAVTNEYLKTVNSRTDKKIHHLPLRDIASKQLNIPNPQLASICEATNVTAPETPEQQPEIILKAYFASRKIISRTWRSKTVRKTAPVATPDVTARNRWGIVLPA